MCSWMENPFNGLWYPSCRRECTVKMERQEPPQEGESCPWCATEVSHSKWDRSRVYG